MTYKLKGSLPCIKQKDSYWCIPASIEIALKYLQPTINVSQEELWSLLGGKPPSFIAYNELLSILPKFSKFLFEHWGPGDIADLINKIKGAIKNGFPVLLSMPAIFPSSGWHIRVCREITDDSVVMYNPGNGHDESESFTDIESKTEGQNGGDILIIRLVQ